jgi:hypothetical protein
MSTSNFQFNSALIVVAQLPLTMAVVVDFQSTLSTILRMRTLFLKKTIPTKMQKVTASTPQLSHSSGLLMASIQL